MSKKKVSAYNTNLWKFDKKPDLYVESIEKRATANKSLMANLDNEDQDKTRLYVNDSYELSNRYTKSVKNELSAKKSR